MISYVEIYDNSGVSHYALSATPLSLKIWTFITAAFDGSGFRLYLNGTEEASSSFVYVLPKIIRVNNYFGKHPSYVGVQAYYDDIKFYNKSLS